MTQPTVFHVEIRQGHRTARAFNVEAADLRRGVLDPWSRGQPVALGDRDWKPAESALRVLEGPRLEGADLALGQGWHYAERSARDVTAAVLRAAVLAVPIAVRAPDAATGAVAATVLEKLGARGIEWAAVREGLLGRDPTFGSSGRVAGALLVVGPGEPADGWLFDAGLAIGALGRRAVVARLGPADHAATVGAVAAIAVDPADPASVDALAARVREVLAGPAEGGPGPRGP